MYIINASVNYAAKCMIVLAQSKHPVSSAKLAEDVGTSQRYVLHICSRLKDSGINLLATENLVDTFFY
ncbi:MAG TPA: Rrf2 family transcriptional regulator [Candidatus Scatomorpha pullicola]|nr:Rrf2 family transcriptional regulator [Candidatus Scatomorpha pullicola]